MVHDSGDNQNADRFPAESWTASPGITGPLPLESPDHIDRNTHVGSCRPRRLHLPSRSSLLSLSLNLMPMRVKMSGPQIEMQNSSQMLLLHVRSRALTFLDCRQQDKDMGYHFLFFAREL